MAEKPNGGKWVDTRTNKVVSVQPVEGRQLLAPGTEITPEIQAAIDAAELVARGETPPVETAVSTASTRKGK